MKLEIPLKDETLVEVTENSLKHISRSGKCLYETSSVKVGTISLKNDKFEIPMSDGSIVFLNEEWLKHVTAFAVTLYEYNPIEEIISTCKDKEEMINKHFFLMDEKAREEVAKWLKTVKPSTLNQERFIERVEVAVRKINYDYKIATLEPSLDSNGNIIYKEGKKVAIGLSYTQWSKKASLFFSSKKWHSYLATLEEGDMFKAYRIASGLWSIEYVCDDSSADGNYWDSPTSTHNVEFTGAREVGGFKDGVGNSVSIFRDVVSYVVVGGEYIDLGAKVPVAKIKTLIYDPFIVNYRGCGVLVLKRPFN